MTYDRGDGWRSGRKIGILLWVVQVLLAALFLFAGGFKLVASAAQMQGPPDLPLWFMRFIGVCEVTGALGLILPGHLPNPHGPDAARGRRPRHHHDRRHRADGHLDEHRAWR